MNIKGFDKDLCCRGFQFEIGKTYDTGAEEIEICSNTVFHYCKSIQDLHNYYNCNKSQQNRYCKIEVLGKEVRDDKKYGSNKIKIVSEIVGEELNLLLGLINGNNGLFNTGYYNTGDYNTGDWNSCINSNGVFCTVEPQINIFNIPTNMTLSEFRNSKYFNALNSSNFVLTEWINYTDKEKSEDKEKELIGGYLKEYTYKEACKNWWLNMYNENKEIIKSMPNFDNKIFEEITGIVI